MRPSTPIPPLMRDLPRDHRGLPITYTSIVLPDGRYDFTRADMARWFECAKGRLCSLCGKRLPKRIWFVGGPLCMTNRLFFDLAMHEECARYALVACPYLATPNYQRAKKRAIPDSAVPINAVLNSADAEKPAGFGLACTDGYVYVKFQGDDLVRAKRWVRPIEWWRDGARSEVVPKLILKPDRLILP